jgi:hypothetical protein
MFVVDYVLWVGLMLRRAETIRGFTNAGSLTLEHDSIMKKLSWQKLYFLQQ